MRALLLAIALLLTAAGAHAQASWLQIGDPQFGIHCDTYSAGGFWAYEHLDSGDACLQAQMEQMIGVLDYAEDIGVDFVVFMGDHNHPSGTNQNAGSTTRLKLGELLALYPTLDIRYTLGNHDYEAGCVHLPKYMLDNAGSGGTVRNNAWDYWNVNNVYFIIWPTGLFSQGTGAPSCAGFDTNQCVNISGTLGAACTAGAGTDKQMVSTCGATEFCNDLSGWTTAAWTTLNTHIGAWKTAQDAAEDPGSVRLVTFSHWPVWWQDDTSIVDSSTFSSTYIANIEDAVNLGTTTAASPFLMLFGHWHENGFFGQAIPYMGWENCNPTIATGVSTDGVRYTSLVSAGPAYGKDEDSGASSACPPTSHHRISAWHHMIDAQGVHTMRRVLATGQRGTLP